MKIALFSKNTPILNNFQKYFCLGLKKHNIKYCLYDGGNYDLVVSFTFNNKAQQIIQQQKKNKGLFLTIKSPILYRDGIVNFDLKELVTSPSRNPKDIYIFTDLLDTDYERHRFVRCQTFNRFKQLFNFAKYVEEGKWLGRWKNTGYLLIPEQFRPEGFGHDIKTRKDWLKWINNIYNKLRKFSDKPVVLKLHPGRPRWQKLGEDLSLKIPPNIHIVKDTDYQLNSLLLSAGCLSTVSSKLSIEAILSGLPILHCNTNCPTWSLVSYNLYDLIHRPNIPDRYQWLCDMAYSHWSLEELAKGDYWNYLTQELLS